MASDNNVLAATSSSSNPTKNTVLEGEIIPPTNTLQPMRFGLWVLAIGFGGFLLWMGLAPLDEGVPTSGMVTIDTKRKAVQHLTGGIVKEVFVKEGQYVNAEQVVITLNDAVARASHEAIRQRYLGLLAMEGRLLAEQAEQGTIQFAPQLLKEAKDPQIQQHITNQQQLFQSRRRALEADINAMEEGIKGQMAAIQGYEGIIQSRNSQLSLLTQELKGVRDLVQEGYAPRNRQLELERAVADNSASLSELQSNISRAQSSIVEIKMRVIQRNQEYRKEIETQIADIRREVQADAEKFKASIEELSRMVIRAPAEGQVVGLAVQTVGGVIQSGQKLMDIVPKNEALLIETHVAPHLIDRVKPGLATDVRFSAFAHSPQLVVIGLVDSISSDLITDPATNMSYYLARVSVTDEGMEKLGNRQLQAGMPVEVIIKTGERSVLTYLLHPLLKRLAASMKEE